jgi:hypothetical protein
MERERANAEPWLAQTESAMFFRDIHEVLNLSGRLND